MQSKEAMMDIISCKSVLVVDDDAKMLRALDKVLTGEGAVVTCAQWAGDAIEILTQRDKPIDLIITDLRMPFVSGLTALYAIHKMFPNLPVIVLTAFGNAEVREECVEQGASAFLEKPLDSQQLLQAVRKVFHSQFNGNAVPAQPEFHVAGGKAQAQNTGGNHSTKTKE